MDSRLRVGAYIKLGNKLFRCLGQPPELDGLFEIEAVVGVKSQVGGNVYVYQALTLYPSTILDEFELVRAAPEDEADLQAVDAGIAEGLEWYRQRTATV